MTREHTPRPGVTWIITVDRVETVVSDTLPDAELPRPNRAARRARARARGLEAENARLRAEPHITRTGHRAPSQGAATVATTTHTCVSAKCDNCTISVTNSDEMLLHFDTAAEAVSEAKAMGWQQTDEGRLLCENCADPLPKCPTCGPDCTNRTHDRIYRTCGY
ncbi:hypothetical protein [Kitasatospora sp. NPDC057500]|uniref:hypothetical protein n=1 Tax=Kitasatospora sp. NPDC057500 TaxID=3346151 RepID=UPI00367D6B08